MFGLEDIGKGTVEQATANLGPLLRDMENRAGGILHGILDRLNGTTIALTVSIPPRPKAEAVEN